MKLNSYHLIVCSLFLGAVYLPFAIALLEDDQELSEIEKRSLQSLPKLPVNTQEFVSFPKNFDDYYQDHFGLREKLTKQYRSLKYTIGDSPSPDVTIGKDGFLFLGTVKTGYNNFLDPMGDYRGINKYSPEDISLLVKHMNDLNNWLAQKGIKYVLVIAPNKETIYPEMLPNYIQKVNKESSHDQIVAALKKLNNFLIIDLRETLIAAKEKGSVYYKTDTHWNYYGANTAQGYIISKINQSTENNIPVMQADIKSSEWDGGDLADIIGVKPLKDQQDYPYFSGTCNPKVEEQKEGDIKIANFHCDTGSFNLLIFGDSFSNWLKPFFSRTFKNSTFVSGKLEFSRIENNLNTMKPDFIIEEWVERTLPYNPPKIQNIEMASIERTLFESSQKIVFHNAFDRLQLINANVTSITTNALDITSEKEDPVITFPEIEFEQEKQHIFRIKLNSTVDSILQVFFSEFGNSNYPYSENNSIKVPIKRGDNDIYIQLTHPTLGKALRLDPISGIGSITISELTLKEID